MCKNPPHPEHFQCSDRGGAPGSYDHFLANKSTSKIVVRELATPAWVAFCARPNLSMCSRLDPPPDDQFLKALHHLTNAYTTNEQIADDRSLGICYGFPHG